MTIDDFTVFHRPNGPGTPIATEFRISHFVSAAKERARSRDIRQLGKAYGVNVDVAPKRGLANKRYLVESHHGNLDGKERDVRSEDRFAMALRNASKDDGRHLALPGLGNLEILEYQMPFNARDGDIDAKAADLFGLVDGNKPCVVELKMPREAVSHQDTPLYAILQGLTYCSLIQANGIQIAEEAGLTTEEGELLKRSGPILVVMAPSKYWRGFDGHHKAKDWRDVIGRFVASIKDKLQLDIHLIALDCKRDEEGKTFTLEGGIRPRLVGDCRCKKERIVVGGVKF
jgi:hypothetical protein